MNRKKNVWIYINVNVFANVNNLIHAMAKSVDLFIYLKKKTFFTDHKLLNGSVL